MRYIKVKSHILLTFLFYFVSSYFDKPIVAICLQFYYHKADIKLEPNALRDMPHVGFF
jgi:hypothetical protein